MRLLEVVPDPDSARRIDLQVAVPLDVPELARARVIEDEHDGREALRQVDLLVQQLRYADRAIPPLVDELEVAGEPASFARVAAVGGVYKVVFDDRNLSQLVRNPGRVFCRKDECSILGSGAT